MSGYTKVFGSIIHSTVWREPNHIRLVWITMLAMAGEDGVVEAAVPGLMDAARVTRDEVEDALDRLMSPDPDSRNPDHEGRRIAKIDGGWLLLNHDKYKYKMSKSEKLERDRENSRIRSQRYRLRQIGLPEDGGPCAYCGGVATGPDHVIPKTMGGEEVVLCCPRCNQTKAASHVVDFLNWHPEFVDPVWVMRDPVLQKHVAYNGSKFLPVTGASRGNHGNHAKTDIIPDQTISDQNKPKRGSDAPPRDQDQEDKDREAIIPPNPIVALCMELWPSWPQDQIEQSVLAWGSAKLKITPEILRGAKAYQNPREPYSRNHSCIAKQAQMAANDAGREAVRAKRNAPVDHTTPTRRNYLD